MIGKIIKKLFQLVSYLLLLVILIPLIGIGLAQIPAVQDYGIRRAFNWIGEETGTNPGYSQVHISSFNRIDFADLYFPDQQGDTLLYSNRTTITTPVVFSLLLRKTKPRNLIKQVVLQNATFNLQIDSSGTVNLDFLVDYLTQNSKPKKEKKPIRVRKVVITDSKFYIVNQGSKPDSLGIDFGDMRMHDFQLSARNLEFFGDTVRMKIDPLSFEEQSKFTLENLSGDFELCKNYLHFKNTEIKTGASALNAENLKLSFSSYKDFRTDSLPRKVELDLKLDQSRLNMYDLGYFADVFYNTWQPIDLAGQFFGKLSNLKGKQFLMGWGSTSFLSGEFSINGLPEVKETFIIFDLNELVTNVTDIENLGLPGDIHIQLPDQLSSITNLRYKGNYTGFLNDFVANGQLITNLGSIYTDLLITPDSSNAIRLSGSLNTKNFNLGALISNEELVKDITADVSIDGQLSKDKPISADIEGSIDLLTLKDYPYQNIQINGSLTNRSFDGELDVNDPNLIMNFRGLIDMASDVREYNFNVNLIDANLYALNISDADPNYHASFLLRANARGANLDELNGEFNLLNSLFSKTSKQIQVYGLDLITKNTENRNEISIQSDLFDAEIHGKYTLSALKTSFVNYLHGYIPALFEFSEEDNMADTRIDFKANFKRTQPFFDFFFPDYIIGENSELVGFYHPEEDKTLKLTFITPELQIQSNNWKSFVLNLDAEDSVLVSTVGCQSFNLNQRLELENFTVETKTRNNRVDFNTRWLNWDSTLYKGNFTGHTYFARKGDAEEISIQIDSTGLTLSDTVWNINQFAVNIDTNGVGVKNLHIQRADQSIRANGKISDVPGDSLRFSFDNFDLSNLNFVLRKQELELGGVLNGNGNLTGKTINPLFFSALNISDLVFNGVPFGQCSINSLWDNKKQSLSVSADAKRGMLTMLELSGDYYPSDNGKMDFNIKLDKLRTNILNPFLQGVFSDIRGFASGELQMSGFRGQPMLSGKLLLQKNAFSIDYLMTRYNFTTEVEIVNNNFILNNIEIFDKDGNYGYINGMVRTEYLKDFTLNLGINLNNLLCLDTQPSDNSMFYGTAYATGNVKIKGEPSTLEFTIDAKTERNTRFFIPLDQNSEVSEYDYVSFLRNDTSSKDTEVVVEQTQQVDLSGIQMDFNLDVTPDAEVQIIFDPTMGDIIKARGSGDMQLSINTLGRFDLVGKYTITKGDYLFTLQNVINKRLKIEDGSSLQWTGDPFNADIDITAVYSTRASISGLGGELPDPSESSDDNGKSSEQSNQIRQQVNCMIYLSGKLMTPNVDYDIVLPMADDQTRQIVNGKIGSEESLTKQFLSLMVLNSFIPERNSVNEATYNAQAGVNQASELLSSQLSNWLSQISNDFDLGFTYRPGVDVNPDEVELALSTQLLNDKLSINGSVDMSGQYGSTQNEGQAKAKSKFSGDFDIDYKLDKKGKLRLRAFQRSSETIQMQTQNTTGFGVFYKEEFDSFGELVNRYWAVLSGKKKKAKADEAEAEND